MTVKEFSKEDKAREATTDRHPIGAVLLLPIPASGPLPTFAFALIQEHA